MEEVVGPLGVVGGWSFQGAFFVGIEMRGIFQVKFSWTTTYID